MTVKVVSERYPGQLPGKEFVQGITKPYLCGPLEPMVNPAFPNLSIGEVPPKR